MIDGLSDVHAAQLFVVRAPRSLDRDELTLEVASYILSEQWLKPSYSLVLQANEAHKDPILAFARTKLLQSMKVRNSEPCYDDTSILFSRFHREIPE